MEAVMILVIDNYDSFYAAEFFKHGELE